MISSRMNFRFWIFSSLCTRQPQPTIAPTRTPSTDEPSASPVTQIPSIDTSVSPSQSDSIAPSAPTQHPTIRMSQVPSVAASESPTGSPLNPTPSPIDPTLSPHNPTASPIDPTLSPVHPSRAPTDYPTLSPEAAAPVPVPIVLVTYDACPNELASTTMHTRNDVVSFQVGSTWKVYRCAEDHCSATGSMPVNEQSDSSWILVGTCRNGPPEPDDSKTTREVSLLCILLDVTCLQILSFYNMTLHYAFPTNYRQLLFFPLLHQRKHDDQKTIYE